MAIAVHFHDKTHTPNLSQDKVLLLFKYHNNKTHTNLIVCIVATTHTVVVLFMVMVSLALSWCGEFKCQDQSVI